MRRESLELPDGDVTAVDWVINTDDLPKSAPLLVILHGLESSGESAYARMLIDSATRVGWRCCVLHFRDCGDYRNRLPRRYHAGETSDLTYFLKQLVANGQEGPLLAAGYSFSKLYQHYLLKSMKSSVRRKFDQHTAAFNWDLAMSATTFAEFDDAVTAPLHGFDGGNDYYDKCSAARFLGQIAKPTLIINALDDPFMTPEVIPHRDRLSEHVTLEVSDAGGHVGFIEGGTPWRPKYYLPPRILQFLSPYSASTSFMDNRTRP